MDSKILMKLSELSPHAHRIFSLLLKLEPAQEAFIARRLSDTEPGSGEAFELEYLATCIVKLVDAELVRHLEDYLWLCREQVEEELFFRRNGRYRLETFQQALEQVYSNAPYMERYMNGLLMTQLFWANHTRVFQYYRAEFLDQHPDGFSHLEIGPGHGLFLHAAASHPKARTCESWDISESSIKLTTECLQTLGGLEKTQLKFCDLFEASPGSFDSVVLSEVLEHMENPRKTLEVLRANAKPTGRLFINMPINSPAPDHLFNCATPEAFCDFVESCGLEIEDRRFEPATGCTLQRARDHQLTINCALIVTPVN